MFSHFKRHFQRRLCLFLPSQLCFRINVSLLFIFWAFLVICRQGFFCFMGHFVCVCVCTLVWTLECKGNTKKFLKQVLFSRSDYNAPLFSALFVCPCVCVCARAGIMALCLMVTEADVKAVLHCTRDRRQTGWNPAQFTLPALHRQPR